MQSTAPTDTHSPPPSSPVTVGPQSPVSVEWKTPRVRSYGQRATVG